MDRQVHEAAIKIKEYETTVAEMKEVRACGRQGDAVAWWWRVAERGGMSREEDEVCPDSAPFYRRS